MLLPRRTQGCLAGRGRVITPRSRICGHTAKAVRPRPTGKLIPGYGNAGVMSGRPPAACAEIVMAATRLSRPRVPFLPGGHRDADLGLAAEDPFLDRGARQADECFQRGAVVGDCEVLALFLGR